MKAVKIEELFLKQRKIILTFSTFVILFNLAGSELSKINFLGNEIILHNPKAFMSILLIFMTYFFLRYLQLMHGIKDKGISAVFFEKAREYIKPYTLNRLFEINKGVSEKYGNTQAVAINNFKMFEPDIKPRTAYIGICNKKGGVVDNFAVLMPKKVLFYVFIKASIYLTFRTHYLTEYAFPIFYIVIAYASYIPKFKDLLGISL